MTSRMNTYAEGTGIVADRSNGDAVRTFYGRGDKFYALICDGMGSGREAMLTSRVCINALTKLLSAGCSGSLALNLVNNLIRAKRGECFTTVDMFQLDLQTGAAVLTKSAAAPSYVMRDGRLYKLSASTMPVGITRDTCAEEIRFELTPGDLLIMASDGISRELDESAWLPELLASAEPDCSPDELAAAIMERAEASSSRRDDMTVAVLRLSPAF